MQTSARSLDEVYISLAHALDELDAHGQGMAALHLAMAIDSLKISIDGALGTLNWDQTDPSELRLVASS